jgi:hypothetical protein
MTRFTDLAQKSNWNVLYQDADRYGVTEWAFSKTDYNLRMLVTVAAWMTGPDRIACESFAGVSSSDGFTREAVRRLDAALTDFQESIEFAGKLIDPAMGRAEDLARMISDARAQGRTELFEGRFVTERAADSF